MRFSYVVLTSVYSCVIQPLTKMEHSIHFQIISGSPLVSSLVKPPVGASSDFGHSGTASEAEYTWTTAALHGELSPCAHWDSV